MIVTFTASILLLTTLFVTELAAADASVPRGLLGVPPTASVFSPPSLTIPVMGAWFEVPNLTLKPTF